LARRNRTPPAAAPRAGDVAKRVLVRARKAGRAPARLLSPFVLHEADGTFTPAAEAVLRHAAPLAADETY